MLLSIFHIIKEEPSEHDQSNFAFASQNIKFARQMPDDWQLIYRLGWVLRLVPSLAVSNKKSHREA